MNEYYFKLALSAAEVERGFYSSGYQHVRITSEQGTRIQLAIRHLVPFVTHQGINGRFCLRTDTAHKFISLEKIN